MAKRYTKGSGSITPEESAEPCRKWRLWVYIDAPDDKGRYPKRSRRFNGSKRAAKKALAEFIDELEEELSIAAEESRDGRSQRVALAEAQEEIAVLQARLRTAERLLEAEREANGAPKDTPLIDDYALEWLDYRRSTKSVACATIKRDEIHVRTLLRFIGGKRLHEITPADVRAYYSGMMKPGGGLSGKALSGTSAQDHAVTLTMIMKQAVNDGMIPRSPCDGVKLPRIDTKERRALMDSEVRVLLRDIGPEPEDPRKVGVLLALRCGLRRGEVCALCWGDVDLDSRRITVAHSFSQARKADGSIEGVKPTKTSKVRIVPLDNATASALASWKKTQRARLMALGLPQDGDRPVVSNQYGGFTRPTNFGKWWDKYSLALGVEVTLHQLRHSFANALKDAGVPIRDAMVLMGHSDSTMLLKVYQHASDAALVDAVSKVGELMDEAAEPVKMGALDAVKRTA